MLIKTLYFQDIKDLGGGIVRPSSSNGQPLYKEYKSIMIFAKIKKRISRMKSFPWTYMPNIDSLRQ